MTAAPTPTPDSVPVPGDEVWTRLIDATVTVVAREGYAGTRLVDVAREADVPVGALFGRFRSKNDLLRQALVHLASTYLLGGT